MGKPLSVLIVEDNEDDVHLVLHALRRGGYEPNYTRVIDAESLRAALDSRPVDVILCDYTLPRFSGPEALRLVRETFALDVPFIFVSGTVGEETAAGLMRAGAADYVLKANLARLPVAIEREIGAARAYREKELADRKLDDERRLLRQLLDSIPDGVYFKDLRHRHTHFNGPTCGYLGVPDIVDLVGETADAFVPAERARALRDEENGIFATGRTMIDHIDKVDLPDRGVQWFSTTKAPIRDGDGAISGLVGITRDITARMRAEEERREMLAEKDRLQQRLRQAEKMESLGTLAGGIAHEFNNLLTPIVLLTEMTSNDLPPYDKAQENLRNVLTNCRRATELIERILAFSRTDQPARKSIRLSDVIRDAIDLLKPLLPSTILIRTETAALDDFVFADETQLHQVVINLASNATDAMSGGVGELVFTIDRAGPSSENDGIEEAVLSVRDTGCGMDRKTIERIFEPFFTTKGVGDGTGMGMAIVHGIIASHGGRINVDSARGEGTTFHIYLPLSEFGLSGERGSGPDGPTRSAVA